jgi:hypothetical protein
MYLYVIQNKSKYKVGVSKDPRRRLRQLQTGAAGKLVLVKSYSVPDKIARKLEQQIHKMFWQRRLRFNGEWFDLTDAHLEVLETWLQPYLVNEHSNHTQLISTYKD